MLTAFLSFKYSNSDVEHVVRQTRSLLEALNVRVADGRDVAAHGSLNDQLKSRIGNCDLLICTCLKAGNSNYIQDEMGYALGCGKPVIVITDDVQSCTGLLSERPMIVWRPDDGVQFATDFVRAVHRIQTHGPAGIERHADPIDEHDADEIFRDLNSPVGPIFPLRRKSFHYDIVLETHPDANLRRKFYKAAFSIQFEARLTGEKVVIETARTVDNFHETYRKLLKDPRSIYRYILKTSERIRMDERVFKVKHLSIDGTPADLSHRESVLDGDEHMQLVFEGCRADAGPEKIARFNLEIETIVDKTRNEFTVIFGYPVKNLSTSLIHSNTDISHLDVVDVVTSIGKVTKSRIQGSQKGYGVKASLDGWVFPDSAIIYVWDRAKNIWPSPSKNS
ncbi:MAG: hypothetical protein R3C31_12310 [Hyphomonadaceae bacterium]